MLFLLKKKKRNKDYRQTDIFSGSLTKKNISKRMRNTAATTSKLSINHFKLPH